MELALLVTLVASFAVLAAAHAALVFGLAQHRPRWRALLAVLIPPLAPYWGAEAQMPIRTGIWLLALSVYLVAVVAAHFGK